VLNWFTVEECSHDENSFQMRWCHETQDFLKKSNLAECYILFLTDYPSKREGILFSSLHMLCVYVAIIS